MDYLESCLSQKKLKNEVLVDFLIVRVRVRVSIRVTVIDTVGPSRFDTQVQLPRIYTQKE